MQETWVWSLGWEVSLKKGMATHSNILACRIPWREEPGGYSPWGHRDSDMTQWLTQVQKSEWPPSKNKCLENMWRKGLCCPVGGNITWHSHYGEHDGDSLKTRNKTTIWSSNPLTRQINWENHNYEIHMYCNVHCSTIYNSKYMETTHVSTERWMDKDVVVHKYNGILLSHKKDGICVSCCEMDEPRAWYTEWRKSEREKQIYINEYIYGI